MGVARHNGERRERHTGYQEGKQSKRPLARQTHSYKDVNMDIKELGWEMADWTELVWDRDKWGGGALRVLKVWKFFISLGTASFSRTQMLHGIYRNLQIEHSLRMQDIAFRYERTQVCQPHQRQEVHERYTDAASTESSVLPFLPNNSCSSSTITLLLKCPAATSKHSLLFSCLKHSAAM
jgi:hypothetical protein